MSIEETTELLLDTLGGTLPGIEAQLRMSPRPRPGWVPDWIPDDTREGAALILLYPAATIGRIETHLVLTVRHADLPQHPGQVSLPGGAREPGEGRAGAALREAHEEIGLQRDSVDVLGELTRLHIPVSGFVLHPVVARAVEQPAMRPDEREVERIVEVPLGTLCGAGTVQVERWIHEGTEYDVPFFAVDGEKVWGATAMILAELLWLLGHPPNPFND